MAAPTVIPYAPRRIFVPFHMRPQRWAAMVAHRRAGKTVACVNDLIAKALSLKLPHGRYAYVAPFLAQAKEIAWEYLKRYARPATRAVNESELWVELVNGSRVRIHGADNPDRLRGAYLDGVICDEYADMRPSVWGEVLRPMLSDRGGWGVFIGTPKGRNEFYEIFRRAELSEDWFSAILKASETSILPQSELDDARRDMTPEQYEQEFECSFEAAILGAYYGKEIAQAEREGRIKASLPVEPGLPVHTAWDLGNSDHMAIWCWQVASGEIRVVDYLQSHGHFMDRYCADLDARDYRGIDYVPHDARVRSIETGRTRLETLIGLGRNPSLVSDHKVQDGINAVRLTLPKIYFDGTKCAAGIEALRQYRAEYDEKLRTFKDTPKKDWAAHPSDAFRYMCMAWREQAKPSKPEPKPPFKPLNEITFDEWIEMDSAKGRPGAREPL